MQKIQLADGSFVYFETSAGESAFGVQSLENNVVTKLDDVSDQVSKVVAELAEKFTEGWKKIKPDEFEIELGVTLGGEGSIIISKVKVEANITVKATWKSAPKS